MIEDESVPRSREHRSAPEVVAPTTRVNVSLPFSKIQLTEPSEELGELAAIVSELTRLLETVSPVAEVKELHKRAEVLRARLR